MNNTEIIKALKKNDKPFGLMSEEMQARAKEIGIQHFAVYESRKWCDGLADNETHYSDYTYRLRSDYQEEPELRHGDYGEWVGDIKSDTPYIHINHNGTLRPVGKEICYFSDKSDKPDNYAVLGNIFDDLAALQEPVEEGTEYAATNQFKDTTRLVLCHNKIHLRCPDNGIFTEAQFDDFVILARRMQATLKQKK